MLNESHKRPGHLQNVHSALVIFALSLKQPGSYSTGRGKGGPERGLHGLQKGCPPASQQGNRDLSPPAARNQVLPTAGVSLHTGSATPSPVGGHLDFHLVRPYLGVRRGRRRRGRGLFSVSPTGELAEGSATYGKIHLSICICGRTCQKVHWSQGGAAWTHL